MVRRDKSNYVIQAVSHAIDVLDAIATSEKYRVGVTEVAGALGLHKNNAFRLLATLENRGLVSQDPDTEEYTLGSRVLSYMHSFSTSNDMVRMVLPVIESMIDLIGETTSIAVLRGDRIDYPVSVEPRRGIRIKNRHGSLPFIGNSVSGRVVLANMTTIEREALKCSVEMTEEELERGSRLGYLVEESEINGDKVTTIGMVIRFARYKYPMCLETQIPTFRLTSLESHIDVMARVANAVRNALAGNFEYQPLVQQLERQEIDDKATITHPDDLSDEVRDGAR